MNVPDNFRRNATAMLACGLTLGGLLGITISAMWVRGCGGVTDAPFGCAEFWLFRYQTLGAALLAGAIAVFVARPVFRQLNEMRRQSALHASETLRYRAEDLQRNTEAGMTFLMKMTRFAIQIRLGGPNYLDQIGPLNRLILEFQGSLTAALVRGEVSGPVVHKRSVIVKLCEDWRLIDKADRKAISGHLSKLETAVIDYCTELHGDQWTLWRRILRFDAVVLHD